MEALRRIPVGHVVALCDAYGGMVANVAADATAFPHRGQSTFCIQYYSSWARAADTPQRLTNMSKVYAAMRPHVPGACYVNYCDLDLPDWPNAYWGPNLDSSGASSCNTTLRTSSYMLKAFRCRPRLPAADAPEQGNAWVKALPQLFAYASVGSCRAVLSQLGNHNLIGLMH